MELYFSLNFSIVKPLFDSFLCLHKSSAINLVLPVLNLSPLIPIRQLTQSSFVLICFFLHQTKNVVFYFAFTRIPHDAIMNNKYKLNEGIAKSCCFNQFAELCIYEHAVWNDSSTYHVSTEFSSSQKPSLLQIHIAFTISNHPSSHADDISLCYQLSSVFHVIC